MRRKDPDLIATINLRLVSIPLILQKNFGFSCGYCYEGVLRGLILEGLLKGDLH